MKYGLFYDECIFCYKITHFVLFLGENIYQVTQNGRILENKAKHSTPAAREPVPVDELQHFVNEMLGHRKLLENAEGNHFKLNISDENANRARERKVAFDTIDVTVDNKLQHLMSDMILRDEEEVSFKHDLLDMIGGNDEKK